MGFRVSVYNLSGQVEQQFELHQGAVTIGRATDANVRLMSASVSRHHARLFVANGELRILDLNSSNGVRINGVRIQAEASAPIGATVTLGDFTLRIDSSTAAHRQPVAPAGTGESPMWTAGPASRPWDPAPPSPMAAPQTPSRPVRADATTSPPRQAPTRIPRASDPTPPALVRFGDDGAGERFPLTMDEASIGRGMSNPIQLLHPSVSRVHAHLSRQGPSWIISDAGSANGTRVNGANITTPVILREGDVVQVGDLYLVLSDAPDQLDLRRLTTRWIATGSGAPNRTLMVLGSLLIVLVALAVVLAVAMRLRADGAENAPDRDEGAAVTGPTAAVLAESGEWTAALTALGNEPDADPVLAERIRAEVAAESALAACRPRVDAARDFEASGATGQAVDAWTGVLACLDAIDASTDAGTAARVLADDTAAPALIGLLRAAGATSLQAREFDAAITHFEAAREAWTAREALGDVSAELTDALRRSHILAGDAAFSAEAWPDAVRHYETAHGIDPLDDARAARLQSARRRAE